MRLPDVRVAEMAGAFEAAPGFEAARAPEASEDEEKSAMSCQVMGGSGMSGVKRITVDADDRGRAQQAATRLREVNRELPAMLEAVRQDNQAAIERAAAEVRARQDAVDQSMANLSEQARKLEARTRQRLAAQDARLGELRRAAGQLRSETRAALEDQERRLAEGLERERTERERETRLLADEVTGMRADREQARALAATRPVRARQARGA
jgi:hypothetical protein